MTRFYLATHDDGTATVQVPRYGYSLWYDPDGWVGGKNFHFKKKHQLGYYTITGRDLKRDLFYGEDDTGEYSREVQQLAHAPPLGYQCIEIGAGLGEFIPKLVEKGVSVKPIVIDPANYSLLLEMLQHIEPAIRETHYTQLQELERRAQVINDSFYVRLINTTLGEAIRKHPDLKEIADIVVEHLGPSRWSSTEKRPQDILQLEKSLLKEEGVLLSYLFGRFERRKEERIMEVTP